MLYGKRVLLGVTGSIEAYQAADLIGVLKNQFANPVATGGDAMDAMTHARLEAPAQFFKALSHTSRLCMVEELLRGEKCVLELTALVGADISTVSKHLAVLRSAGIVTEEKRANRVFYSLRGREMFRFVKTVPDLTRSLATERAAAMAVSRKHEAHLVRGTAHRERILSQ